MIILGFRHRLVHIMLIVMFMILQLPSTAIGASVKMTTSAKNRPQIDSDRDPIYNTHRNGLVAQWQSI